MSIPTTHYYSHHANKTLLWIDSDQEESWLANMSDPQRRAQLVKYGWDIPNAITYKFNSDGFRCNEFTDDQGVIALGCSFTAGVGLPVDHIWASLVAKRMGLRLWNLGIGGASMDTCYRLLYLWIERLQAQYVLLLTPPIQRFELHTSTTVHCFHPQTIIHDIQKYWYAMPSNGLLNFDKNLMAIQHLCHRHGKTLIVKSHEKDLFGLQPRDHWPPARDMLHVGTLEHQHLAEKFLKEIDVYSF